MLRFWHSEYFLISETQDETQPKIQTDPQLFECQSTEEIKEQPIEENQPQAVSGFEDDKQENEQNELNIDEGKKDQDDGRNQLNNQEIFEEEHNDMVNSKLTHSILCLCFF